jgi:tRNA 2-selenouridine synthase
MLQRITIDKYLSGEPLLPVIDVRTPAEFATGHIPGAVNIPLFSDEERTRVGTVYTKESPDKAYDLGYKYVKPKLDHFVESSQEVSVNGKVAVYCWRGGMRSRSFAEHIEANGLQEVDVIEGGYKAFRQHALEAFSQPDNLYILGGYTGSGKTRILKELEHQGEQVIDLEGIAHHKGSAFGAIGQPEQPKNEHFTNLLFWEWKSLDRSRPVWLEDESIHIGRVFIPEVLFERMRESVVCFLEIPKEVRAHLLVEEYAGIDAGMLADSVRRISKRLGGKRTAEAMEALQRNDYYQAAIITLDYYDKFYLKGLNRRDSEKVVVIPSDTIDAGTNAEVVLTNFFF